MQPLEFKVKVCTWCKIHCAGIKMQNDKNKAIVSIYLSIYKKQNSSKSCENIFKSPKLYPPLFVIKLWDRLKCLPGRLWPPDLMFDNQFYQNKTGMLKKGK